MKQVLLFSLLLLFTSASALADKGNSYKLGPGDFVAINVLMEDDMSVQTRVNAQGGVKLPYIGQVDAAGKTATELGVLIADILGRDYLVNPQVNVDILEYRPFYIQGAVKQPGSYPFQPGLTVERAASVAGGFTRRANTESFSLARESTVGQFDEVSAKLRDTVHPGDIITIKETYF